MKRPEATLCTAPGLPRQALLASPLPPPKPLTSALTKLSHLRGKEDFPLPSGLSPQRPPTLGLA